MYTLEKEKRSKILTQGARKRRANKTQSKKQKKRIRAEKDEIENRKSVS